MQQIPPAIDVGHTEQRVVLIAQDGYRLNAVRYEPAGEVRGHVIVGGATGVQQRFYRRFAIYMAAAGYATLTFDYRGIGESRYGPLKGFEASFLDWGALDTAAAVDAMRHANLPLFVVGHSFGGHALGLLPNHDAIAGAYCFGSGAGWTGWMKRPEARKVRILWNVVLPLLVSWKGYMPWRLLGMGEDLPRGVYRQWRRWCRFPRYFLDDPARPELAAQFAKLKMPIASATAIDDPWAPPASRDAFATGYSGAEVQRIDLAPERIGQPIGHMGYFRESARPLWAGVVEWIEGHRLPHPASAGAITGAEGST
jgi:predicted alpha/beta hydrolase